MTAPVRPLVEILDRPLYDLVDLPVRVSNAVARIRGRSRRELVVGDVWPSMTYETLVRFRNIGRKSLPAACTAFENAGVPLIVEADHPLFAIIAAPWRVAEGIEHLVGELLQAWSTDSAMVVADWCEERSLRGAAQMLRRGPYPQTRVALAGLALGLGVELAIIRHDPRSPRDGAPTPVQGLIAWVRKGIAHERRRAEVVPIENANVR